MRVTNRTGLPFYLLLKKHIYAKKTAYNAQVEARALTRNETETVRQNAPQVQQSIEKIWCSETAATNNVKCNGIFTRRLPKKLKDFAHKRQVVHTSTVMEPSIPILTLVELVEAEVIMNKKIVLLIYHWKLIM